MFFLVNLDPSMLLIMLSGAVGFRWGRCVYDNICKFLQFQLTVLISPPPPLFSMYIKVFLLLIGTCCPSFALLLGMQVNITACLLACVGAAILTESPLTAIQVNF
jgi:hypothetical protein